MAHSWIKSRTQTMQNFYVFSLTYGRPGMITENRRIKEFY